MKYDKILKSFFLFLTLFFTGINAYSGEKTIITHAVSLSGTPKYKKDFKYFEYVNPDAPKQGTLNDCAIGSFDSFNPYILKGNPAEGIGVIYDTLLVSSNDEVSTYYGLGAEKIEYPEDISFVIFHLNKKARFHDGEKIKPEDIVFSYETLMNNFGNVLKRYYADIEKAEPLDDSRVKFSFKTKHNKKLIVTTGQIPILPKHYWKTRDFSIPDLIPPLGSGPYKIKNFQTGRSITYERVKNYWAKDIPVMKGRYNFNEIRYDYFRDVVVALEAFKAGLYDYRFEDSAKKWATMYNGPEFKNGNIIKKEIKHSIPIAMQGLVFNTRRPVFKNPEVRKALMYAFDYEWANKKIYFSQYKRIKSYFYNSELAAPPLPSKDEMKILLKFKDILPKKLFTEKYHIPETNGSGYARNNLIKAAEILKKNGWEIKERKLVNKKTGKPFRFEFLSSSMNQEKIILPFKKNLEKLGIEMVIKRVDSPQYTMRLRKYDFDMIASGFGGQSTPGSELKLFWHSSNLLKKDARNFAGVASPAVDYLVESIIAEPDRAKMIPLVNALDRVLLWGNYMIPFGASDSYRLAYRKEIKRISGFSGRTPGISTWWKE